MRCVLAPLLRSDHSILKCCLGSVSRVAPRSTCSPRRWLAGVQPQTIRIITHLVFGTEIPCFRSVTAQLDSVNHVNHAFVEPQYKHLRVDTIVGNDQPLRGRWVTTDRLTRYTSRVRIGSRGVAIIPNGPVKSGLLEVPLRDREWWKIITARHVQPGCRHRCRAEQ